MWLTKSMVKGKGGQLNKEKLKTNQRIIITSNA